MSVRSATRCLPTAGLLLGLSLLVCPSALAQNGGATAEAGKKEVKIPAPESLDLVTGDGLQLKATYFGSTLGKKAVPVVILHDFKESRSQFQTLALYLQKLGHAVLVPDLRGHGESTQFRAGPTGRGREIEAAKMRKNDLTAMVLQDLEAVRKFLISENNAGKLNLNKLCVVGSGMGSTMAINWAAVDWSAPVLSTGKQGQDVKGLVLISPTWSFKGLTINQALDHPSVRSRIAVYIVAGKGDSRGLRDAQRMHSALEKHHPEPTDGAGKDLFLGEMKSSLQGTKLLTTPSLKLHERLAGFIKLRHTNQDFPWEERVRLRE